MLLLNKKSNEVSMSAFLQVLEKTSLLATLQLLPGFKKMILHFKTDLFAYEGHNLIQIKIVSRVVSWIYIKFKAQCLKQE